MSKVSSMFASILLLVICSVSASGASAETAQHYNQIHFQAQSSEQVQNDQMKAVLNVHSEDGSPSTVADDINQTMDWALTIASEYDNVQSKTGIYQTYPVHQKNTLKGWRGNQELILSAGDFGELGQLVGRLQERLQIRSMDFSLFPQTRSVIEDQLIFSALDKFKARAELVKQNLGSGGYRIVDLSISTGGSGPMPIRMRSKMMAMSAEVAPPAIAGGDSNVVVTVTGVIELD